jgi:hypothetical protein
MNTMKLLNKKPIALLIISLLLSAYNGFSQGAAKGNLSVAISYVTANNKVPSLLVKVKTKVDGRFQNVEGIPLSLFLNKDTAGSLIGKVVTNRKGEASAIIPAALKSQWKTVKHTFLATFAGNKKYEPATADLTVGKAKVLIAVSDDKKITASVFEMKDTSWTPVKGVELKMAVRRMGGDLPVNETATFTTDSTGTVSADFKRDSLPGDAKGNITLVVKIEDNDQYGSLSIEKVVPWGAKFTPVSNFNERSLHATRDKAPYWLLFIASSIVIAVWGILIYLVFKLFKIKKLGKAEPAGA